MPQKLTDLLAGTGQITMQQIGLLPFLFLLAVSLAGSLLASYLYLQFYSSRATGSHVHRSFPLLGLSITAIFVCIQFSLPLSLGLLGALSIVRFRTPIKEPEEIGFIMLVIAVSIATATFKLAFVGLIFVAAIAALLVQTRVGLFGRQRLDGTIVVTVPDGGGPGDASAVTTIIERQLPRARIESLARHDGAVVMSYAFESMPAPALTALQAELPAAAPAATFSVFFSRPGAL